MFLDELGISNGLQQYLYERAIIGAQNACFKCEERETVTVGVFSTNVAGRLKNVSYFVKKILFCAKTVNYDSGTNLSDIVNVQ